MDLTIYKYGTIEVRTIISPDDGSQQSVSLMGEDNISLTFSVASPIQFQVGDYCYFFGKLYQINTLPKVTLNAIRNIGYDMVLESEMYDLGKVNFLFLDGNNHFTDAVFTFRGRPQDYGDLLIYNLNRVYPTAGWKLGSVIEADLITQDFTAVNCLEALKTIASIFQTEYLIEDKVINIFQRQTASGLILKYGANEALTSIVKDNQTNANLITRLYAFGSTRNITATYRGASTRLRMGDLNYLEKNINLYRVWEKTIIFDGTTSDVKTNSPLPEIYPHRTGTITAVDDPDDELNYFLNFTDREIDFDVNENIISGVTAQITFNTGLLAGYTFDINTFNYSLKKFTINQNTQSTSLIVPTEALKPMVGDQYVIINITLPQSYIDAAEAELRAAAQAYLDTYSIPPITFSAACNYRYFKKRNIQFVLAQTVTIESDTLVFNTSIRVTSYTRNIRNPYLFSMVLSDTVKPNSIIVKLLNGL